MKLRDFEFIYTCTSDVRLFEWYVIAGRRFAVKLRDALGQDKLDANALAELSGHLLSLQILEEHYVQRGFRAFSLEEFETEKALSLPVKRGKIMPSVVAKITLESLLAKRLQLIS